MGERGRRVLITCPPMLLAMDRVEELLRSHGIEAVTPPVRQQLTEEELIDWIQDVDGVIAGDDPYSERVLASAAGLRVLVKWGIGVDGIDIAAARRLGVAFTNTPGAFADEVADVAIAYILGLARGLFQIDRGVRAGGWPKPRGMSLRGRQVGVVGLGSIGRAVIERTGVFGLGAMGADPHPPPDEWLQTTSTELLELEEMLPRADFLVLCAPLTPDTRGLIDADRIRSMKPGAFIVNVARGRLVDEDALAEALRAGHLAGAALDVLVSEPLAADHPLRDCEACVFGSHNASNTVAAVDRVNHLAIAALVDGLEGKEL